MEGQNISVCTVLSSISGDVRRPLLIDMTVTSASADSKYPHRNLPKVNPPLCLAKRYCVGSL